jgi:hypothetical protein
VSPDGITLTAIPDVLSTGLWQVSHEAGANIHSNSWGWSVDFYTISECKIVSLSSFFLAPGIFNLASSTPTQVLERMTSSLSKPHPSL